MLLTDDNTTRHQNSISCIYMTRSLQAAFEFLEFAQGQGIVFHWTAGFPETTSLMEKSKVQVVLVDLPTTQSELQALVYGLRQASPRVTILVVAAEVDAEKWPEAIRSGAFDMVLRPFRSQELVPVLKAASESANGNRMPDYEPA
jgi:DNA-binding NtrC family response regulator